MKTKRPDNSLAVRLLALPRRGKQAIVVAVDVLMAWFAMWVAFTLRLEVWHVPTLQQLWIYIAAPLIFLPLFIRFGLYRAIFRYTGLATMRTLLQASAIYGAVLLALVLLTFPVGVPRSVGVLQPLIFLLFVSNSRAWARFWLNRTVRGTQKQRLLIYGAGSAGAQTAAAVGNTREIELLGFIDDDESKAGRHINGVPVFKPSEAAGVVERLGVTDILLALPSTSRQRRNEIIEGLRALPLHIRTLPGMADLASGRVHVSDFRELDVEDLLGREPVPPNPALLARDLSEKVVLVTGAGGSIGSELCRQIVSERPQRLLLVDHSEFALYEIHQELEALLLADDGTPGRTLLVDTELVPLLGDVRDYGRMADICSAFHPDTVYHAAAYKHVPMVEHNPCEGVENNALGSLRTARAAMENGVASFVLVSTDKAVRPTNVMGASKRVAEMVLQAFAGETMVRFDDAQLTGLVRNKTRFSMVRFGNVLGSSGSVVPLFRRQIESGGPVTVTHPDVTRYFMTIPEAAQLVLQAGAMGEGGEVYVLDMGEPVRIVELAARMIELSGRSVRDTDNPGGEIEIAITGLRPGEKLYEELLIGDNPSPTAHARIMKAHESYRAWTELRPRLAELEACIERNDADGTLAILRELVSGYQPATENVDWVSAAR
ncbi:MAG: nucleoside-diphosphate sugar epimerase/dehydratase [Burkholderiaceae bacterium]